MNIKLLPCPFCGFKKPFYCVEEVCYSCGGCGTNGPMGVTIEIAQTNWNKRYLSKKGLRK